MMQIITFPMRQTARAATTPAAAQQQLKAWTEAAQRVAQGWKIRCASDRIIRIFEWSEFIKFSARIQEILLELIRK